jgi:glycosyltransferase involved in cell wall biosynthesis
LPFIGVEYAVAAAKEAKKRGEAIDFLILGRGPLGPSIKREIEDNGLDNVVVDEAFFAEGDLRRLMLSCHVSLGQLSDHERTWRTIPHKIFETIALGMPLLTARTKSQEEFLCDGSDCLFFKGADVSQLVDKLVLLREDIELRNKIARGGYTLYKERFTRETIGAGFMKEIQTLVKR